MEASSAGRRALVIGLVGLTATAVIQAAVVALSGSVALLGDTLHTFADALTAVPLLVAFALSRRPPTKRHTYGLGRAEDLAGLFVVFMILASSVLVAAPQGAGGSDRLRGGAGVRYPHRACRGGQ